MRAELLVDVIVLALCKEVYIIVRYLSVKCIAVSSRNRGSVLILSRDAVFLVLEFLLGELYSIETVCKLLKLRLALA